MGLKIVAPESAAQLTEAVQQVAHAADSIVNSFRLLQPDTFARVVTPEAPIGGGGRGSQWRGGQKQSALNCIKGKETNHFCTINSATSLKLAIPVFRSSQHPPAKPAARIIIDYLEREPQAAAPRHVQHSGVQLSLQQTER